jgi:late competence protein required for DNA uptake (superfamily II DNA/RNA helicase)
MHLSRLQGQHIFEALEISVATVVSELWYFLDVSYDDACCHVFAFNFVKLSVANFPCRMCLLFSSWRECEILSNWGLDL